MKTILTLDKQDYTDDLKLYEVFSTRAIIVQDGKAVMQKNAKGIYKIPGGTVENGEGLIETLHREVADETGLCIDESSIREIGQIEEIRRDVFDPGVKYVCHTMYYQCDVLPQRCEMHLTESEKAAGFQVTWASFEDILSTNKKLQKDYWLMKDTLFVEMLLDGKLDFE